MYIIFPTPYLRISDGTKQSYSSISDLETKLADGGATYPWQKIEEAEKSWKLTIEPNTFEDHADGTKEVSAEILKLLFSTIKVTNTILNRLQKKAGKKLRIGIAFTTVNHSLNRSQGSFLKDGFESGDIIRITGSSLNDGTYTIDTVYETQMIVIEAVVDESEVPCMVKIGGKVDILFYDPDEIRLIPVVWNIPLDLEVVEEGEEFSRIKMISEKKLRNSPNIFTNAAPGISGSGTEGDPYIITNINGLQTMNEDKNAWYELGCDINASPTKYWNDGKGFEPIGDNVNRFHGKLDGKDFTINNLYINRPSTDMIGLFGGSGSNCVISNVNIINADIIGYNYVGVMVGNPDDSSNTFHNCYVSGNVAGNLGIGGFVGTSCTSTFEKCYSIANVEGNEDIGGFVGNGSAAFFTDCYSKGNVNGGADVGGFVGENTAAIFTNCYSTGKIEGDSELGGFAGKDQFGTYTDCFWDTETSGQATSAGGTGKTTVQMKQEATYTNWNFVTIWNITEDTTYPWLQVFD